MHITSWFGWKSAFLWLSIFGLISIVPFFSFQLMITDPNQFDSTGILYVIGILWAAAVLLLGLSVFMIKKKVIEEKLWKGQQSFELEGYPDLFVYRSYPVFDITIEFEHKKPSFKFFADVFGTLPLKIEYEQLKRSSEDDEHELMFRMMDQKKEGPLEDVFKFSVEKIKASKFNRHRRWARKWIHKACDLHFKALHEKYPIKKIIFGNGTSEFDFDWSVPRKKSWWIRF